MSSQLERALQNFAYRIKTITPTCQLNANLFEEYEPLPFGECPASTAGVRKFFIEFTGEAEDGGATDITARECEATVRVHVEYPRVYSWRDMTIIVARDRHDLQQRLRDPAYYDGYEDDSGVTAAGVTGIFNRRKTGGVIDRNTNPAIWRYTTEWRCWIRESEL